MNIHLVLFYGTRVPLFQVIQDYVLMARAKRHNSFYFISKCSSSKYFAFVYQRNKLTMNEPLINSPCWLTIRFKSPGSQASCHVLSVMKYGPNALKGIPQTSLIIIFLIFFILSPYIPSIDNNTTANNIQMESFTRLNGTGCLHFLSPVSVGPCKSACREHGGDTKSHAAPVLFQASMTSQKTNEIT